MYIENLLSSKLQEIWSRKLEIAKFAYVGELLYVKEDFLLAETRLYYSRETENEENPLEKGWV